MSLKNLDSYDSFKLNQLKESKIHKPIIRDDVWQQDEYYTTSYPMDFDTLVEIEMEERGNYTKQEMKEWLKMYGLSKSDEFRWVAKTPAMASRYAMNADLWNGDKYIEEYNSNPDLYNVMAVPANNGVIILESDDGDWGAVMVTKEGKDKVITMWTYMKYKLEEMGGILNNSTLSQHLDTSFDLKQMESMIKDSDKNFVVLSNFKHLGGIPKDNVPVAGGYSIEEMIKEYIDLGLEICREVSKAGIDFKLVPQYGTYYYNEMTSYIPELSWIVYSDSTEISDIVPYIATKYNQESVIVKTDSMFGIVNVMSNGAELTGFTNDSMNFTSNTTGSNLNIDVPNDFAFNKFMFKNGKLDNKMNVGTYSFVLIEKD